jgi:hypothetical protein
MPMYNAGMATAAELGLQKGDPVAYFAASKSTIATKDYFGNPATRVGRLSGIPLDTPGANVHWTTGRVTEIKKSRDPYEDGTHLVILDTNDPDRNPGQKTSLSHGFNNFYSPDDKRLMAELESAGIIVTEVEMEQGKEYRVSRVSPVHD